ncbi:MAG: transglutaminase domain-containing protein [Clostridia bacterium]|nr:transglutaminase domain-containing protein [Clostridia bacterium]
MELLKRIWNHKTGKYILLGVVLLLALTIFLLIYRPGHRLSVTLEAGEPLPDPVTLTKRADAVYRNAEAFQTSVPGTYKMKIDTDKGTYRLRVTLKDTTAPTGTVTPLRWGLGTPMPDARAFFSEITDATEVSVTYLNENSYTEMTSYPVALLLRDAAGNETRYETTVTLVNDTTPPTVTIQELSGCIGYGIVYSKGVICTDDCCGEITVKWDASAVDTNTPGQYPVYYTVTDAAGNQTHVENTIYIYEEEISPEMLYVRVDAIIDRIITADMNKEARVRAVYRYVYDNISYAGTSDKSDWMREAYQVLLSGSGDCFSYFALAKAFFERLGIENMDIQRTTGLTPDRHYWNYVNIGTKDAPRWYYFDATHLNSLDTGVTFEGSLLTEKQISAYNKVRANFYTFDHTGYPTAATEIVTKTPDLEPYYG